MKRLLFVLIVAISMCVGLTSCKAWRTISTTATYTQATDSKNIPELKNNELKNERVNELEDKKKEVIRRGRFLFCLCSALCSCQGSLTTSLTFNRKKQNYADLPKVKHSKNLGNKDLLSKIFVTKI